MYVNVFEWPGINVSYVHGYMLMTNGDGLLVDE